MSRARLPGLALRLMQGRVAFMTTRSLLGGALVLLACGGPARLPAGGPDAGFCPSAMSFQSYWGFAGEPQSARVDVGAPPVCYSQQPTSATASVAMPDGGTISATASLGAFGPYVYADVRFSSSAVGRHVVAARFEPLGVEQTTVFESVRRVADAGVVIPGRCSSLFQTRLGWACGGDLFTPGGSRTPFSASAQECMPHGTAARVSCVSGQEVRLYDFSGNTPLLLESRPMLSIALMAADARWLVLERINPNEVVGLPLTATGYGAPVSFGTELRAVALLDTQALAVASLSVDGETGTRVCLHGLDATGLKPGPDCRHIGGRFAGVEPSAVWIMRETKARGVTRVTYEGSWQLTTWDAPNNAAIARHTGDGVAARMPTISFSADMSGCFAIARNQLEHFASSADCRDYEVRPDLIWSIETDGLNEETRVRFRAR